MGTDTDTDIGTGHRQRRQAIAGLCPQGDFLDSRPVGQRGRGARYGLPTVGADPGVPRKERPVNRPRRPVALAVRRPDHRQHLLLGSNPDTWTLKRTS
ncbi:hypothetical protein [Streptomyces sp. NPDC090021]|uniref:hypothetical protein n=1 Tax=Streptomyces sp. NPDC090021 TaxID=3365919 RepID=UPI00381E77C4